MQLYKDINGVLYSSDLSPIIVNPRQKLTHTHLDSCLEDLTDVTLAFEDGNSKLVEVVTVADHDAEKHVDARLEEIWKLKFGF